MKELDKLIERINEYRYLFATKYADQPNPQMPEDILLFPRPLLKMDKIRSGKWKPRAWFIEERLVEEATRLEDETSDTGLGLTSGFRSAIIKENGMYLKLKGVSKEALWTYDFEENNLNFDNSNDFDSP
jgi:hypothetical protein